MQIKPFLIGSVGVLALITLIGSLMLIYFGSEAQVISADLETPTTVLTGQPFDTRFTLENTSNDSVTIISIGLEKALVEQGLSIVETVPRFRTVDTLDDAHWTEYTFAIQLRPVVDANEILPMRLRLVATQPGHYEGELTVWTKNRFQADYIVFSLDVLPHPVPWLGG